MLFESLLYTLLYFLYVKHSIALNMNMEKLNFGCLFENIPVVGKSNYVLQMIENKTKYTMDPRIHFLMKLINKRLKQIVSKIA